MNTTMTFTASGPLYCLSASTTADDISNQIAARQSQLTALLSMTCGEQGATFRMLSDDLQDAFMWACSMLASEIQELTDALQEQLTSEGRASV